MQTHELIYHVYIIYICTNISYIYARINEGCIDLHMAATHIELFSKSYQINLKSDCIYHIRLIWNQTDVRLVPNQSENGKYNLISG